MVESMTGYIVRLAQEHCVSAGVLYWKEIRTLAAKGNIFYLPRYQRRRLLHPHHQRLGLPAADFVRALEILTGRRDLSCLTLLTWRRVLPGHSLLRRCRAWVRELYVRLARSKPTYLRAPSLDPAGRNRLPVPSPDLAPNVPAL